MILTFLYGLINYPNASMEFIVPTENLPHGRKEWFTFVQFIFDAFTTTFLALAAMYLSDMRLLAVIFFFFIIGNLVIVYIFDETPAFLYVK